MTHFPVLVIVPANKSESVDEHIAKVMKKYDENRQVKPYITHKKEDAEKHYNDQIANLESCIKDPKKYDIKECQKQLDELKKLTPLQYFNRYFAYDEKHTDKDGNAISSYNPDSKWDYYGGGWQGFCTKGTEKSRKSIAKMKDIDWDLCQKMRHDQAVDEINEIEKMLKARKPGAETEALFLHHYSGEKRDDFIAEHGTWHTCSVVDKQGAWHEPSKMGWWAIQYDEKESNKTWALKFHERFIKDLDPEDTLVILDCHI